METLTYNSELVAMIIFVKLIIVIHYNIRMIGITINKLYQIMVDN